MKLNEILFEEDQDYRGEHKAPSNDGYNAPLHDVSQLYPDDIYGPHGERYYGDGDPQLDYVSIYHIKSARNKPNMKVKIYRAVPKVLTNAEKIAEIVKQKAYILKYRKLPKGVNNYRDKYEYYDYLSDELDRLTSLPEEDKTKKTSINKGDWVTLNPRYAKEHGETHLNGKYKIISKSVPAKHVWTDGNSIHEFGYDPD